MNAETLGRRELIIISALWALLAAVFILINLPAIGAMTLPDADDHLRLQQVRDWIGGQAWFDVSQHRVNPPDGGLLHWTRLVDIPLALVIVTLTPLIGQANAEMAAAVLIPALTMGVIMLLVATITARLVGRAWVPLAALAAPLSGLVYTQIMPLRVDHHGWQVVAALTMLWALLDEARPRRSGAIAAIAAAVWLNISLEALPMAAVAGALLALRWLFDARALPRLQAFVWTLIAAIAIIETATIHNAWASIECDRFSTPYVLALVVVGAGLGAAQLKWFAGDWRARLALGAFMAAFAAALFASYAPGCLAGPFGTLEPLTRTIWLDNVGESLPLWRVGAGALIAHGGFALIGIVGAALALRAAPDETMRLRWLTALVLSAVSAILMVLLMRMGAVAHAFAAAGAVHVARLLFERSRAMTSVVPRVLGTTAALLIGTPIVTILALRLDAEPATAAGQAVATQRTCSQDIASLSALPAGVVFAPLDVSPSIIAHTPHAVVATGHHRNHAAMNDVISAFVGDAETARTEITAHHAAYVALCVRAPEASLYKRHAANGFASQLINAQPPAWLEPVHVMPEGSPWIVYRVR